MNFIKLRLEGHIGKDPELRYTPSGKAVCTFTAAFNPGKKDDNKPPVWFNFKAWNDLAVKIAAFKKGEGIKIANAFLDVETWKDREGNEKSKQVWIVMSLAEETVQSEPEPQDRTHPDIDDSDIPF